MSTTILSVAFPFARVAPEAVGGAEQVLCSLEGELFRRGYRSVVLARQGSTAAGEVLETEVPPGDFTPDLQEFVTGAHRAHLDRVLASGQIDLVHMHGIDFFKYPIPFDVPVLVILHLPPSWYPEEIWCLPANYRLQCVSETQRLACPAAARDRLAVVRNGVPLPDSTSIRTKRGFALMLSRISQRKTCTLVSMLRSRQGCPSCSAARSSLSKNTSDTCESRSDLASAQESLGQAS